MVVANGSAPDGSRYEWVAYRCKVDDEDLGAGFRGVGLSLDWPGVKGREAGGDCEEGAGDEGRGVFRSFGVHILPSQFRGVDRPDLVISGSTGPAVHRVSVVYVEPDGRERELDVDFARVEGKLRRLASRSVPLGTFVAFLPGEIAARDEVETRLDLRAMESTGKLEVGPIARRELAEAAQARTACESAYPDNATLAELARLPLRSAADGRRRDEAFTRVFAAHTQCMLSQRPRGPFEYVAYDAQGRVLDRFREPLILPATAPREPAGREPAGEVRLPYPPVPGAGRPVVLVSGRAPDGALFELYTQEMDGDVCINLFWPYVFEEGASGACGPELPPAGAFGRKHPERVAARGYGFLNDAAAATRHSVMTGFARAKRGARRGDLRGLRRPQARRARHARAHGRRLRACGSRSCRVPPAAVPGSRWWPTTGRAASSLASASAASAGRSPCPAGRAGRARSGARRCGRPFPRPR